MFVQVDELFGGGTAAVLREIRVHAAQAFVNGLVQHVVLAELIRPQDPVHAVGDGGGSAGALEAQVVIALGIEALGQFRRFLRLGDFPELLLGGGVSRDLVHQAFDPGGLRDLIHQLVQISFRLLRQLGRRDRPPEHRIPHRF